MAKDHSKEEEHLINRCINYHAAGLSKGKTCCSLQTKDICEGKEKENKSITRTFFRPKSTLAILAGHPNKPNFLPRLLSGINKFTDSS